MLSLEKDINQTCARDLRVWHRRSGLLAISESVGTRRHSSWTTDPWRYSQNTHSKRRKILNSRQCVTSQKTQFLNICTSRCPEYSLQAVSLTVVCTSPATLTWFRPHTPYLPWFCHPCIVQWRTKLRYFK